MFQDIELLDGKYQTLIIGFAKKIFLFFLVMMSSVLYRECYKEIFIFLLLGLLSLIYRYSLKEARHRFCNLLHICSVTLKMMGLILV